MTIDQIFSKSSASAEVAITNALDAAVWLLDYYTLLRLLKKFNNPRRRHPDTVQNAVIYAGSYHCVNMVEILEKLGYRKIAEQGREEITSTNCLNISQLPIFSR